MIRRRVFISYKFSGLAISEIHHLVDPIYEALKSLNCEVYCNLYDSLMYEICTSDIMKLCLSNINSGDIFLLVAKNKSLEENFAQSLDQTPNNSSNNSPLQNFGQGSMIELGWALAKNCTILGHIQEGAQYDLNKKLVTPLTLCTQINIFQEIGDTASLVNMVKAYL